MSERNVTVMPQRVYIPVTILRQTICKILIDHQTCSKPTQYDFPIRSNSNVITRIFFMPTTRMQKKAGKSRGQEVLSDIENLDIMLGGNHFDEEESEDSILARRPKNATCNASDNAENTHLNSRENRSGISTDRAQISTGACSSVEF